LHYGRVIVAEIIRGSFLWASSLAVATIFGVVSTALATVFVLLTFSVLFNFCRVGSVI